MFENESQSLLTYRRGKLTLDSNFDCCILRLGYHDRLHAACTSGDHHFNFVNVAQERLTIGAILKLPTFMGPSGGLHCFHMNGEGAPKSIWRSN